MSLKGEKFNRSMKTFVKKLIKTLPIVAIGAFVMGSALQAAEPGVGEVSGFAGIVSIRDGGGTHGNFGGTMGANLGRFVHLFGEVNYMAVGTVPATATGGGKLMNYGGGVQIRIPTGAAKIEPYGLITLGYGRMKQRCYVAPLLELRFHP